MNNPTYFKTCAQVDSFYFGFKVLLVCPFFDIDGDFSSPSFDFGLCCIWVQNLNRQFLCVLDLSSSSSSPFFFFFFAIWMFGNMATLNPAKPVRSARCPPEPEPNHPLSGGGRWWAWWFGGFHPNQTSVPPRTRPHPPDGQP